MTDPIPQGQEDRRSEAPTAASVPPSTIPLEAEDPSLDSDQYLWGV